jgi:glycosyltransferase involved in cell wall biosynthesis
MKVVAVVLTHNALTHERLTMLSDTLQSLSEADEVLLVDNGSDDGSPVNVVALGGFAYRPPDGVSTCGRGMNVCIGAAAKRGDLVVFSNDDIVWREGWRASLEAFWEAAPADVLIVSGLLEMDYPWNKPRGVVDAGGVRGLVRETVPGGAWTLRSVDWPRIGPIPEQAGWDDVPTCRKVNGKGGRCVSLDLSTHAGEGASTWGNKSAAYGKPLDRERWGV